MTPAAINEGATFEVVNAAGTTWSLILTSKFHLRRYLYHLSTLRWQSIQRKVQERTLSREARESLSYLLFKSAFKLQKWDRWPNSAAPMKKKSEHQKDIIGRRQKKMYSSGNVRSSFFSFLWLLSEATFFSFFWRGKNFPNWEHFFQHAVVSFGLSSYYSLYIITKKQ